VQPCTPITTPSKTIRSQTISVQGTVASGVTVQVFFNGSNVGAATVTGTTWTFSLGSQPAGTYAITAQAFLGSTASNVSNTVTIVVSLTAPAPPTRIRTTPYATAIDVEWDPSPTASVVGYLVYRKTGTGGTFTLISNTGVVQGTKYRDTTVTPGTTYFYHVTSVDGSFPN